MTVVGLLFVAVAAQADNLPKRETMAVTHLTREDFRTKIYDFERNPGSWKFEGDKPALVDFYASWCGPCKMLAPVLEELGDEYAGRVDIYKVNVDEQQELAALFGASCCSAPNRRGLRCSEKRRSLPSGRNLHFLSSSLRGACQPMTVATMRRPRAPLRNSQR